MNRKRSLLIIMLLVSSALPLLITVPMAEASELVVSISHSYDDVWVTEVGNVFSNTFMVMMLDNDIGIHSFLRFQGLEISKNAKINYATLTVYVAETHETPDPGSSVTVYGIDEPDCAPFTSDGSLWSLSRPYTSASVNWNTTAWAGYQSVNVTDIVKEIINQYAWSSGNDLGLQILGGSDSGQWPRSFEDYYHAYHEGQAELTIVYDVAPGTPPGLPPGATFVETYQEWDIWKVETLGFATLAMYFEDLDNPNDYYYGEYYELLADNTDHVYVSDNSMEYPLRNTITQINETVVIMEDPSQITMWVSNDDGATWASQILNDQYTDLATHSTSSAGSMWTDENATTHMIWNTYTDTSPASQVGVYSNFTVLTNGTIDYFDGFTEFSDFQDWQNIEVDRHGRVHIAYATSDTIYYRYRHVNGTWEPRETIYNSGNAITETSLDVADHHNATRPPIVRFVYHHNVAGSDYAQQTIRWSNGTVSQTVLSSTNCNRPNSGMWREGNQSISVYADNPGGLSREIEFRIYDFDTMTLGDSQYVTATDQSHHVDPDVGIDETMGIAFFVWQNQFLGHSAFGRRYNLTSGSFIAVEERLTSPLDVDWVQIVPWAIGDLAYTTYYIVDMNETVLDTWTLEGENFTDIDDLKDFVDDYIDPGGGDPMDPDPGTQGWDIEGPFTRFKTRLYILFIGLGCVFIPLWAMAYKKFDAVGYAWCFLIMVLGVGLLWSITGI